MGSQPGILVNGDSSGHGSDPIAIVGIACRLPGHVASEDDLWSLLQEARSGQGDVPASRFNIDAFYNPQTALPDSIPMRGGYFLEEDLRSFENSFFGINNLEAINMDPQQRKLLEVCFECLESAGIGTHHVAGKNVGCYIGNFTNDFTTLYTKEAGYGHRLSSTGQGATLLSNRISYILDLKGPSLTLDTACSSSLYSLHLAVQALRQRECDAAFVAGANLIQSPEHHMGTARLGVLSKTSTCHTFASDADGYGRAEGVNALYIKRLSDALRDGDPIRSVIRGTAINSNGKGNGITMPSVAGQRDVIDRAYANAGIDRYSTAYVECHGTGTPVGDPIEVAAVSAFFRDPHDHRKPETPIYIGSVKSNLGHSEATSGLTSIIKATLALEKQWIPATIGATNPNPDIPWHKNATRIVTSGMPWPRSLNSDECRRVSVNSFGYGGSNAHCILEAYIPDEPADSACSEQGIKDPLMLFPLSAATEYSLCQRAEDMAGLNVDLLRLTDVAHTLIERRSRLPCRGFIIGRRQTWSSSTQSDVFKQSIAKLNKLNNAPTAFIFTGQGAQWPAMGKDLYEQFPTFRQRIQNLDHVLANLPVPPQTSLQSILLDPSHSKAIHLPEFSQPACTAVQIALIDLLEEWGISPEFVVGHSSGEIAAAYAAGYISASTAIIIAHGRGVVVSTLTRPGAMLAAGMSEEEANREIRDLGLQGQVRVACVNSPENITISGDADAIGQLADRLTSSGRFARKLLTGGKAYHSHHMSMVGDEYASYLETSISGSWTQNRDKRSATMISSVRACVVEQGVVTSANYWRENLESPVLFSQAIEELASTSNCQMIELGPHPALELVVKQTISYRTPTEKPRPYLSSIVRNSDGAHCLMRLAGRLWTHGYPIRLDLVNGMRADHRGALKDGRRPRVIPNLPRYKWCYGDPLWSESRLSKEYRFRKFGHDELLGTMVPGMSGSTYVWRNKLSLNDVAWLNDHRVGDEIVFPGAAYIDMAVKALQQIDPVQSHENHIEIQDMHIQRALALPKGKSVELFTELKRKAISGLQVASTAWTFTVSTFEDSRGIHRAGGDIVLVANTAEQPSIKSRASFNEELQGVRGWYRQFEHVGLGFGPAFQTLGAVHCPRMRNHYAVRVELKGETVQLDPYQGQYTYRVHPTIIDSQFQACLIGTTQGNLDALQIQVPTAFERIRLLPGFEHSKVSSYQCFAQVRPAAAGLVICNAQLFNERGQVVLSIENMSATMYVGALATKPERHPMLRVDWIPDLHRLSPGHCDGLTRIMQEATAIDHETENMSEIACLLSFAAKTRCESSILIATELLDIDSMWKMLGGGSKHTFFSALAYSSSAAETGFYYEGDLSSAGGQLGSSLQNEKFDIIVADSSMEDRLSHVLGHSLNADGLLIYSGELPSGVRRHQNTTITTTGQHGDLSVLRRPLFTHLTVNGTGSSIVSEEIVIVSSEEDAIFADSLERELARDVGVHLTRCTLDSVSKTQIPSGCTAVVTAELYQSFLTTASLSRLRAVQELTDQASRIVWLTGGSLHSPETPDSAAVLGFSRAVMAEQPALRFQVIGLEAQDLDGRHALDFLTTLLHTPASKTHDLEFLHHHGIPHVSRFIPSPILNTSFNARRTRSLQNLPLSTAGPVILDISTPGALDTLHFRQLAPPSSPPPALPPSSVEISVRAIGLNAKDLYALMGRVPTPERTFACECTGVVTRTGADVRGADLRVGDRVVVAAPATFAPTLVVPDWACVRMRPDEDFAALAAVPIVYMTALHALRDRAGLEAGERVLIHSATGGVGLAAIQVAGVLGAEVYATAGTEEKREILVKEFGVARERVFGSRDSGFLEGIKRATDGEGVDVVLNSLIGEKLHASLEACAMFGRFVEIGKRDILDAGNLNMACFAKGLTFSAFDLTEYYYAKSRKGRQTWARLLREAVEMYRRHPVPAPQVFDIGQVEEAFRAFSRASRTGKVCVSLQDPGSLIKVKPTRHAYRFRPDKTYLLVGCLGGLGRSLTRYMLENGARSFVFVGRTGTDKPAARSLVDDLRLHGASVQVVRGDVQDYKTVLEAVDDMTLPLGGVVQAAMGSRETLFSKMSHENWHATLGPKVQGSWNIHRAIEGKDSQLDFFLMTSSLAGSVGMATKSNYCVANCFLDYFAKYRRRLGKPATSIGFGTISEIGYLHEHPDVERMMERHGYSATTEADFLDICDTALCSQSTNVLTGLEMSSTQSAWDMGVEGAVQDAAMDPRLSILSHAQSDKFEGHSSRPGDRDSLPADVDTAVKAKDRTSLVQAAFVCLAAKLSRLVLMPVENINADMALSSVGMDSMLASEYRSFIFRTFKTDVPFLTLMDATATMNDVASLLADRLLE